MLGSSCLSVHIEQLGFHWTDFEEIFYLNIFKKICQENSSFVQTWQNYRHVASRHVCPSVCLSVIISRRIVLRMRNVSDKSCIGKQNPHFMFNNFFSPKIVHL